MNLPKKRTPPESLNPRRLFLFAHTKVGKTTVLAALENNLIIDLEDGTGHVEAMSLNIKKIARNEQKSIGSILRETSKSIQEANLKNGSPVYDYISIDTASALEETAKALATHLYKQSPIGKNFEGTDVVRDLARGAGYLWLRTAFSQIFNMFDGLAGKCLILTGHVKDASITKGGQDVAVRDVALTGKLKQIICQGMDAIGYMYRDVENTNQVIVSFENSEEDLATGARPVHLRNQKIILSEYNPANNSFIFNWDKIFI